jgi:hypothetical protein
MTAKKAATQKATTTAAAPAVQKADTEKVRLPVNPVKPGEVKTEDQMHNNWACFMPSHYNQAQVEDQKTWTFMATRFRDLDMIRVTAEDGSWIAMAVIRRTVAMELTVQVYDWIELAAPMIAAEIDIGNDYVIRHFGTVRKFAVCNKVTGAVVKEGFNTQVQAMKYAGEKIQAAVA